MIMNKITDKVYEINRLIEEKGLPLEVQLPDFSFSEAEELSYRLMEQGLRTNLYKELKILRIGIYEN